MCRSIKKLRNSEIAPTTEEIDAAALQFVRKITGYNKPPQASAEAFNSAVSEIGAASRQILEHLYANRSRPRRVFVDGIRTD